MLRRIALALVASLLGALLAASTGAAAPPEEQLGSDVSYPITATPGWASWQRSYAVDGQPKEEWVLWHTGSVLPSPQVRSTSFGTDAKGRAVALDSPCYGCRVVERRLADGSVRPLRRRVVHAADESAGTLAYVRRGLGVYVLRPRARHVERVARLDADTLALSRRWLVYSVRRPSVLTIAALDLRGPKPRKRVLASDDDYDEDCRCMTSYVTQQRPTVDGRFAYWVRLIAYYPEGPQRPAHKTEVLRVDLTAKRPAVETFSPQHLVEDLAVAGGVVFYSARQSTEGGGVFRVPAPEWQKTTLRIPVQS